MSRAPHLMQIRSPKPMGNTECKVIFIAIFYLAVFTLET